MKAIILVFSLVTIISSPAFAMNPSVVATINGEEINQVKLNSAVESFLRSKGTNSGSIRDPKKYRKIRESILDVLISQELLWQAAKKDKMVASDESVEVAIKQFKENFKTEQEFNSKIQENGFNEKTYRADLKQKLSVQSWLKKNVYDKVKVDKKEIHSFYKDNHEKFIKPEQVRARHILRKISKDSTDKEKSAARKMLKDLIKKIKKGGDFAELAKKHSQGPSAAKGGDLGYFSKEQMVKPFSDAAFAAKKGKVTGIVETQFGYHIILVEDKQAKVTFKETEVSENINRYLMNKKSNEAVTAMLEKLRKEAKIKTNAI